MKSASHLLLVAILFYFSSCSKKEENNFNPYTSVVKTINHSETGFTDAYTYDTKGRIQLIQSTGGEKTTFVYTDSSVIETFYDKSEIIVSINNLVLDSFGLVNSSTITDRNNKVQSYHVYTFDNQRRKTGEQDFNESHVATGSLEWAWGDNMWNYSVWDAAHSYKLYDTYYWYYDPAVTSVGNANVGQKFWGADSKYLVRESQRHSYLGDQEFKFKYTIDRQRIIEVKTFDHTGALANTDSYTYY